VQFIAPGWGSRFLSWGAMMAFHKIIWVAEEPPRADQSAMCAINRHLPLSG